MKNGSLTTADESDIKVVNHELGNIETSLEAIGPAVTRIKERGNWKNMAKTWGQFCESQGWSRRWSERVISSWKAVQSLPEPMRHAVRTQRAATALSELPEKDREQALESVLESGEKVTGPSLKKAATSLDKPTVEKDATGTKIPTPALPYWQRRNEVQPWLNQISAIKCAIQDALKEQDPLFAWIGNPAIDFLSSAYAAISNAKLYAVCTDCQGWGEKKGGCGTCHNTGLISKHHYDVCSRREIKEIRERANALKL